MIETKEKYIDGATYSVTQLPARRAIKLKAKLIKMFGPVLAQFLVGATQEGSNIEQKTDLVKAVQIFSSTINENELESLMVELLNGVRKDGMELTPQIIDLEFAGDLGTLYSVAWFVIEVNFANFFSLIGIGSQLFSEIPMETISTKRTFTRA